MKGDQRQNPFSASRPDRAGRENPPGSVADLFAEMVGKARRNAEAERLRARSRGPVAKCLLALTLIAAACAVATGVYGVWNFPDAPIRFKDGGYVGKTGKARTRADYEAYAAWKGRMLVVFPSVFILGFAFALADSRSRREKTSTR
jgi:hypothetical protein